jgi:hypothetical protein
MVYNTSSDDARTMEARVKKAGEAIREGVESATTATAAVAGRAKQVDDADEATQQAWSKAGGTVEDAADATTFASRQIADNPFIDCAIGYVAGWWIHGRR